jgi:hypothetical protein
MSSGCLCAEREELWGQRPGVRDRAVYLLGTWVDPLFFSKLLTELTACRLTITSTMPTVGSIDESAGRVPETE